MKKDHISLWIEEAEQKSDRDFRMAVHTVLTAIAMIGTDIDMTLKGGLLLAIQYQSRRYTKDIDFSTKSRYSDFNTDYFLSELQKGLNSACAKLPYETDCKIQSHKLNPKNPDATFPTLTIKIGYAKKGSNEHKRLLKSSTINVIPIDYSFNEITHESEILFLSDDNSLKIYSFTEIIAEKIRSLLQQEVRNRFRRQDVYDLHFLMKHKPIDELQRKRILDILIAKSVSRGLKLDETSISEAKIIARAERDYSSLAQEIDCELPPFDEAYSMISNFYKSLPWETINQDFINFSL